MAPETSSLARQHGCSLPPGCAVDPGENIRVARQIVEVWRGGHPMDRESFRAEVEKARNPPVVAVDSAQLTKLAGRYDFGGGMALQIVLKDGRLALESSGKSFGLQARSQTDFYAESLDAELHFEKNDAGKVTLLRFRQGDEDHLARKAATAE